MSGSTKTGGTAGASGSGGTTSSVPAPNPRTSPIATERRRPVPSRTLACYGRTNCLCGFGQQWSCTTCPETKPSNGRACDSATTALCVFGFTYCDCNINDYWECIGV